MYFSKSPDLSQSELQVQTDLLDDEKENVADDLDGTVVNVYCIQELQSTDLPILLIITSEIQIVLISADIIGEDEDGEGIILQQQLPWEGTERDYEYEEVCILFQNWRIALHIIIILFRL